MFGLFKNKKGMMESWLMRLIIVIIALAVLIFIIVAARGNMMDLIGGIFG